MGRFQILTASFFVIVASALPAAAQDIHGKIKAIYPDPSDYVIELDVAGPCGSKFFHIQRSNTNFREVVATSLTGFSLNKNVTIFTTGICSADRNISSHIGIIY